MKKIVMIIVLLLCNPDISFGGHPLITDDSGTLGKKVFQAEINSEASYDKETEDNITTKETAYEISTIMTYGISDNIDFVLGVPYQWIYLKEDGDEITDVDGISDISLELKWRFFEIDALGFALKPGIALPSGDEEDGLGSGEVSYSLTFIATREIDHSAIHFNAAYMRNEYKLEEDEDTNRKDIWHVSIAAESEITDNLVAVVNAGIERNSDKTSNTHPSFILCGVVYSVSESLDIDFGIKAGLNSPETDYALLAGVVLKL
jgi:hypothetical protein